MSIATQCLIVNVSIGCWTGQRLDKDASRKVTTDAQAAADAARVNKHLVQKDALAPITSAAGAIRQHFYSNTLPWQDNGNRIVTRKRYATFLAEHAELVGTFDAAVETFITTTYPEARDRAAFRMGELWKPTDYPSPSDLRRRFYVTLDMDPVAETGDIRVEVGAEERGRIAQRMEAAMRERIGRAMTDVWGRLMEAVEHFHSRVADPKAIFRDSLVTNLQEIVELLPDLNLLDDPNLERLRYRVATHLGTYEPKTLRENPAARSTAATEAQAIMQEMAGFMAAFGGGQ